MSLLYVACYLIDWLLCWSLFWSLTHTLKFCLLSLSLSLQKCVCMLLPIGQCHALEQARERWVDAQSAGAERPEAVGLTARFIHRVEVVITSTSARYRITVRGGNHEVSAVDHLRAPQGLRARGGTGRFRVSQSVILLRIWLQINDPSLFRGLGKLLQLRHPRFCMISYTIDYFIPQTAIRSPVPLEVTGLRTAPRLARAVTPHRMSRLRVKGHKSCPKDPRGAFGHGKALLLLKWEILTACEVASSCIMLHNVNRNLCPGQPAELYWQDHFQRCIQKSFHSIFKWV